MLSWLWESRGRWKHVQRSRWYSSKFSIFSRFPSYHHSLCIMISSSCFLSVNISGLCQNLCLCWSFSCTQFVKDKTSGEIVVLCGTLDKLLERLTSEKFPDVNFRKIFMLVYQTMISGEELLVALDQRWNVSAPTFGRKSSCWYGAIVN